MRKQTEASRYDAPIAITADDGTLLATCTFAPYANKVPIDQIPADMAMLAKSQGADIPYTLHLCQPAAAELVRSALLEDFSGGCAETKVLKLTGEKPPAKSCRNVVLVGLGPSHAYCDSVVCAAFQAFFNHAIENGAQTVLVPFVINPNGEFFLTHKASAYRLKSIVRRLAQKRGGLGRLREIKIFCTPSAVKSIREGLSIAQSDCGCKNHQCACAPQASAATPPAGKPRRRGE